MSEMERYRPFSKQIERESHMMTRVFFYLYYTPLFLASILPIFDLLLEARGFLLLTVAGGTFIYFFRRITKEMNRIKETYQWVKSKATVNKKAIVEFSALCTKIGVAYRAKILYSYTYEGVLYQSDSFARDVFNVKGCNHLFSGIDELKESVDKLIRNNKITIYINPQNPSESVIKRGIAETEEPSYVLLIITYLFPLLIFSALFAASLA